MPRTTQFYSATVAAYELAHMLLRPRPSYLASLYSESIHHGLLRLATIFKNYILSENCLPII